MSAAAVLYWMEDFGMQVCEYVNLRGFAFCILRANGAPLRFSLLLSMDLFSYFKTHQTYDRRLLC
jgi:hypothetical protein